MGNFEILNPKGLIALKESELIYTAVFLMLLVVIPVFIATFIIARKYRAGNEKANYTPDWTRNIKLQLLWWAILSSVIFTLAVITWKSTHDLDPYKPIDSDKKPILIQVVALEWKWLFIYPELDIATVNFIEFPEDTPLNFELTAEAPMSSFWIPQLGGQVYAMSGMSTKLHLIADEIGEFRGSPAEINGKGFAGMMFKAKATSQEDFDKWVFSVKNSPNALTADEYDKLVLPSENNPVSFYGSTEKNLYNNIIMKFMIPQN